MLQAVQAFVRQAMDYVEKTPNEETKVELIKTLQSVTEGKVNVLAQHVVCSERIDYCSHQSCATQFVHVMLA